MTPDAVVALAEAAQAGYDFTGFELAGGALFLRVHGGAITTLAQRFPDARVTLDSNRGWLLAAG